MIKLNKLIEDIRLRKKHKLIVYFWMIAIPFALGCMTTSYCILAHGDSIGEGFMIAGMKLKSAGMKHVVEDLGYMDFDAEAIASPMPNKKLKK